MRTSLLARRGRKASRRPWRARQGTVYIAVLGVALIIALTALTSVHLGRMETDVLTGANQIANAELLSQAAVEIAISRLAITPSWRTAFTNGADLPSASGATLGTGRFRYQLVDADGSLSDDDRDVVLVRGIGTAGKATQVTTVELEPESTPLGVLDVAIHADGAIATAAGTITTDRMVSSNDNITGNGQIFGDAWAAGSILGSVNVSGAKTSNGTPARTSPEPTSLWDYYLANGTVIDIAAIPSQVIENVVLSAQSNPYGARNPQGIYIITAGPQSLRIRNARIVGTLVVISTTNPVRVESLINWSPPAVNFPSLLVQGNLSMEWSGGAPLVESTAGVNFNPAGTPFENMSDADLTDSYPGIINGLVYCSGNLAVMNPCVMRGQLIAGGTADLFSVVTVAYNPAPATFPPPGFAQGSGMRIVPRTWQRVAR